MVVEPIGFRGNAGDGESPPAIRKGNLHHEAIACAEKAGDVGLEPVQGEFLSIEIAPNREAMELTRDIRYCHVDDPLPRIADGPADFLSFLIRKC